MIRQKSAKCDRRVWRVPVTLENAFLEKKTQRDQRDQRDPVTRVPLWPMFLKSPGSHTWPNFVSLWPIVFRVTYVTQFCVYVSYSRPGHKRDPILWPCVPESNFPPKIHNVTSVTLWPVYQCDRCYWSHNWVTNVTQFCDPVTHVSNEEKKHNVTTWPMWPCVPEKNVTRNYQMSPLFVIFNYAVNFLRQFCP